jgi:hypothetical protein
VYLQESPHSNFKLELAIASSSDFCVEEKIIFTRNLISRINLLILLIHIFCVFLETEEIFVQLFLDATRDMATSSSIISSDFISQARIIPCICS